MSRSIPSLTLLAPDLATTARIGAALAQWLEAGDVFFLHGHLGAGKTTLAKAIAQGLGVSDPLQSPTFTLIQSHPVDGNDAIRRLIHVDLYRLEGDSDLEAIGYFEALADEEAVALVEWPERAQVTPDRFVLVSILAHGAGERTFEIRAIPDDEQAHSRLEELRVMFQADRLKLGPAI